MLRKEKKRKETEERRRGERGRKFSRGEGKGGGGGQRDGGGKGRERRKEPSSSSGKNVLGHFINRMAASAVAAAKVRNVNNGFSNRKRAMKLYPLCVFA